MTVRDFPIKGRTGLFTLLFTDVAGSTQLKARLGDQAGVQLLQRHLSVVRALLARFEKADEISTAGDSCLLLFAKPSDGLRFALRLQTVLQEFNQGRETPVLDRIGLHMGEVVIEEQEGRRDVHGMQVDTCARVMGLAQPGQILMTRPVFDNARQSLKGEEIEGVSGLDWLNHGRFELKGVGEPIEICEVRAAGMVNLPPPTTSEKAHRVEAAEGEAVLGWRPAVGTLVPNTQWLLEEKLGEGGFGEVWLGRHQVMKERRVFKFCFRADRVRSLKREMTLFRLIKERIGDHPNIVALREVYFEQPPYYVEEEYVAGEDLAGWCAAQGGADKVPLETRLEIVAQIADALQAAHDAGVIHRDVKPANILISNPKSHLATSKPEIKDPQLSILNSQPVAKLTDFGIGQVVSEECLAGITRAGFTQTMLASSSSRAGTQLYMAPELLSGKPASTRSDIYSLGVVLYQLLVGDLARSIAGDWSEDIPDPLLRDDLRHCLAGRPKDRFAGTGQLAASIRSLPQRQTALARERAATAARRRIRRRWTLVGAGSLLTLVFALILGLIWFLQRDAKVRWAREYALPEIARLARAGRTGEALALARQAQKYIRNDPQLTNLWPTISVRIFVETAPEGADVYFGEYANPDSQPHYLGKSPIAGVLVPRGLLRWLIEKDGFVPVEQAADAPPGSHRLAPVGTNRFTLNPVGTVPPGMVRVEGGQAWLELSGLGKLPPVGLDDFFIDTFEVSNRQFKEFVDQRGYQTTNYWKHPFLKEGKALTWAETMLGFRDATGFPGPATWKNGTYPEGEDEYPVTGICWFEAAAYAEFVGKRLPSIYHWSQAARPSFADAIVPLSNFAGRGPARAGAFRAITTCGAYDMAGNAKEWCWNEAGDGKRYILGGSWRDPEYMFTCPDAESPFSRSATHGFRCMKLLPTNALPQGTDGVVAPSHRDYSKERPVTDEVFQIYKGLFSYDKRDLDSRIESVDNNSSIWREERVSFQAAYANERVTAFLFLPENSPPPYQVVVYFPGSAAIFHRFSQNLQRWRIGFIVENGRAVIYPIYKSTYERGDNLKGDKPEPTSTYRDHVIMWSKDLGRSLDYLETRDDIQHDKIAYFGLSWGAALGVVFPALEGRLKANILVGGGFYDGTALPEVDQINFAPRVKIPTLMINGRYDFLFPLETAQQPMFQWLGTPPEHKRHVVLESGHVPANPRIEEAVLSWLDRSLGPPK